MKNQSLRRTLRCVSRLGLRAGLQAGRLRRGGAEAALVRLPELGGRPLWIRPRTSDAATFDEIFLAREYDLPLEAFAPERILDLGANVGYASVHFAARWPRARILAVEPAADNLEWLRRNTAAWPNITPVQAAVWPRPARLRIANPQDDANAYRMDDAPGGPDGGVEARTVEQLLEDLGWAGADLVKLDVEGAEAEIFREAPAWLGRIGVLVVELHDRIAPGCAASLYRALGARRFRQEIVGRNLCLDFRPA
jgi:FkbM family methyltransferase